ncbi:hypothetical protein DM793_22010 [Paenarthrobacter nitroguajacolicus]|nr:hypothetical protein [Paenarthrobacter nitroguajacolicus]
MSGGERQRLAIARAMATTPRILLADEPTGNLDSVNTSRVIDDLRNMASRGIAIVVITHDERVAAAADRRLVLTDGVLSQTSPTVYMPPHLEQKTARRKHGSSILRLLESVADSINSLSTRPMRTALLLMAFLLGAGGLAPPPASRKRPPRR